MNAKQPIVPASSLPAYHRATIVAALTAVLCASGPALASDSTWQGGNGNWSDANWLDSDTSTVGAFVAGSRAVINDACTIAIDVDTPAVGGLSFGANAVIAGPGSLVIDSASAAKTIEVASGVAAKISATISGKVRKTGYGSLETTADNYKTLTLSATNVDPGVFEIGTGTWIVSGGSTVHVQTPSSTEGESGWYYFQGEDGSYSNPSKGAYIVVTNNSTLMYSKGKSAPWTCFGPRNKKGHFEMLVTDGSTFKTKSDDFRILVSIAALASRADTLGWCVPEKEWGAWHDPANWALEKPDGEPAGRIPTAGDRFFGEQTFRFDLGGKTGVIGSWGIGSWISRDLFLTNGTLEVAANWPIHGGLIEICNGATLRFRPGSFFMPGASDARGRTIRVRSGGTLDIDDAISGIAPLPARPRGGGRGPDGSPTSRRRSRGNTPQSPPAWRRP